LTRHTYTTLLHMGEMHTFHFHRKDHNWDISPVPLLDPRIHCHPWPRSGWCAAPFVWPSSMRVQRPPQRTVLLRAPRSRPVPTAPPPKKQCQSHDSCRTVAWLFPKDKSLDCDVRKRIERGWWNATVSTLRTVDCRPPTTT
jgi:hypothetical protein